MAAQVKTKASYNLDPSINSEISSLFDAQQSFASLVMRFYFDNYLAALNERPIGMGPCREPTEVVKFPHITISNLDG